MTPVDLLAASRMGLDASSYTREAVEAFQLQALKRTLAFAKQHSAFYRTHLPDPLPEGKTCAEILSALPTTSERDLAGNEARFLCIPSSGVSRVVTVPTTGTHGMRKRLSFSERDLKKSEDFIHAGFLTMGCTEGEKMLVLMSGNTPGSIGDLVKRAMAPLRMEIDVYGAVTKIADAYGHLMRFRPGVLEALPWHAAALARYGARFGNPEREFLRSVNLSADTVPESVARRLIRTWDCTVHRHYGMTELCIFGGVECAHRMGYHTRPVDLLFEIPETDENGYGELLVTTLDREAMPLIRYQTGDIACMTAEPCSCGCTLPRILRIAGRKNDTVTFPEAGDCFFSDLADAVYRDDAVIDFEACLCDGHLLELEIRTLPGERASASAIEEALHAVPVLHQALSGSCGLRLSFSETDAFPSGYNLKKTMAFRTSAP